MFIFWPILFCPFLNIMEKSLSNSALYTLINTEMSILFLIYWLKVETFSQCHVVNLLVLNLEGFFSDLRALPLTILLHSDV